MRTTEAGGTKDSFTPLSVYFSWLKVRCQSKPINGLSAPPAPTEVLEPELGAAPLAFFFLVGRGEELLAGSSSTSITSSAVPDAAFAPVTFGDLGRDEVASVVSAVGFTLGLGNCFLALSFGASATRVSALATGVSAAATDVPALLGFAGTPFGLFLLNGDLDLLLEGAFGGAVGAADLSTDEAAPGSSEFGTHTQDSCHWPSAAPLGAGGGGIGRAGTATEDWVTVTCLCGTPLLDPPPATEAAGTALGGYLGSTGPFATAPVFATERDLSSLLSWAIRSASKLSGSW